MAEIKPTGPLPPPDWDLPDLPASSDPSDPSSSFNDDRIGARAKHIEEAARRAISDRFSAETPRRILSETERVTQASAFRNAGDDEEVRKAERRARQGHKPGGAQARARRRETKRWAEDVEHDVEATEERIGQLMEELVRLGEEEKHPTTHGADELPQETGPTRAHHLQAERRRLAAAAKHHLQGLLAGGVGLSLAGDPRITFRRLLDRIERWPLDVAPGHAPSSEADFDAFLTWAFSPPNETPALMSEVWSDALFAEDDEDPATPK